jgi:hypothetical protein
MREVDEVKIKLAVLWVALMLVYLLGDVLRIFAGDFEAGKMMGADVKPYMWIVAAVVMLIPIAMAVLSVMLNRPASRWINIGAAVFMVIFNIAGLPYKGAYDNFLIGVSFVINALTIYTAWTWVPG